MPNARSGPRRFWPWLLVILVAGLLLWLTGLLGHVRSFALTAGQPVSRIFYGLGVRVSRTWNDTSDLAALQSENERLRDDITSLQLELANLQQAEQENLTLRQLLDYFETDASDLPRVLTRVVSRDQFNPSLLTLNVGQRDGVQLHNAVVAKDGILVAKIVEVYARSSKALLLTDGNISVASTISGGAPTSKIVRGERGLSLILDQVPQQEIIEKGQLVMTSGLEATIPRGLLVGEIEEIISERNDLFQRAVLKPLVDYGSLTITAVILTPSSI